MFLVTLVSNLFGALARKQVTSNTKKGTTVFCLEAISTACLVIH